MRPGENPEVERVSGYRVLSDEELQLVNDIKALGPQVEALIDRCQAAVGARYRSETAQMALLDESDVDRKKSDTNLSEGLRHASIARTNFQQGAMWLIRAVAAPDGLF